jgi:polyisoprenyl-phosphate glycosyltransferase
MNKELLSIIVPVYNEQETIQQFYKELHKIIDKSNYELIFVNDGSCDNTFSILQKISENNIRIVIINLSRNFGHQNALMAGFEYCHGSDILCMDSDLQHPPSVIPHLITQRKRGFDVVNTRRIEAEGTGFIKKITANYFYKIFNKLSGLKIDQNSADFRLVSRRALNELMRMNEKTIFIRGMVQWIGFNQTFIEYKASKRIAGKTKYSLKRMVRFAADGILSFSSKPLKASIYIGMVMSLFSFLYGLYAVFIVLFKKEVVTGWASLLVMITLLGGLNLIFLGLIGQYIARIYDETKDRPRYIIKDIMGGSNG